MPDESAPESGSAATPGLQPDARRAPGWPGIEARWTSSAKSGVGTAAAASSHVWFTLSHGIVNEVYFPRTDIANTRDMGFLVADGESYFSEEKRDCESSVALLAPGAPGFVLTNRSRDGRYQIEKTIITHPHVDALLQHIRFTPSAPGLRLYVLLAPHLENRGMGNDGSLGDYKGMPMLFAQRGAVSLAMACSVPFRARSVGYVGTSDGWQDISANKRMTFNYESAPDGNIALVAEIDLESSVGDFVVALGFGGSKSEAGQVARLSLEQPFAHLQQHFLSEWLATGRDDHRSHEMSPPPGPLVDVSVAVLRAHESKRVPGGFVASLSIPWGNNQGDDDLGGYHLVWPRDLVQSAGGLLAAGDHAAARRALQYLIVTQEADGRWPQNMWLDGTPYWPGIQMDEIALPILLADQLEAEEALGSVDPWPMVRKAAAYLARNGPVTPQDRWEEDAGYSPFTLAVEIAALLAAADFADNAGEAGAAQYLRETADSWNSRIERWTYVSATPLAKALDIDGYYVRIAPEMPDPGATIANSLLVIKNQPTGVHSQVVGAVVSPDALALVRFGLRRADDPRIVATVRAIDSVLKSETVTGPTWHRYVGDGYGEHEDGSPFDGTGVGRGWPLFTGERAHYELAAGHRAAAESLFATMARQTSEGGLLPEQIWDTADLPERELFNGKPAGSAMPLAWAHAEYLKLARSLQDGAVFDCPRQTAQRYANGGHGSNQVTWRLNSQLHAFEAGCQLRVELLAPATAVWTTDAWHTQASTPTRETGLGIHIVEFATAALAPGSVVEFTVWWRDSGDWQGSNFQVSVTAP